MSWWSAPDASNIEIGDEVLDEIRNFLFDFSKKYQTDLKRKPTIKELEYAIDLSFRTNIDGGIFADFDELRVKQVIIKIEKILKRKKVKPGDIFAIKLELGNFAFGRIVSLVSIGAVVEIFDYFSSQPILDISRVENWLITPITIGTHSIFEARTEGDWRVIGATKDFTLESKHLAIQFIYGDADDGFFTAVDVFDRESKTSVAEGKKFPFYSIRGDQDVKDLINDALAKRRK